MIRFFANDLVQVAAELNATFLLLGPAGAPLPPPGKPQDRITAETAAETVKRLNRLHAALSEVPCPLTKMAIYNLPAKLENQSINNQELKFRIAELHNRLRDELGQYYVYALEPAMRPYAEPEEPPFGLETDKAFPGAAYDIIEASKCFAFRRSTACVTHLMRALELPLTAMAIKFGVPHDRQQWNTMIEGIESKLKDISEKTHGTNWKEERDFYAEAAGHFRHLKNGWRNHAMHNREKYTPDEAELIFKSTKAFMSHLSQKLCE